MMTRLILLLALLWPVSGWAAIAVDTHGKGDDPESGGTSSQTESLTIASGATALYVGVSWETDRTVSSCVWDNGGTNQSLTSVGSRLALPFVSRYIQLFRVFNPTSGTHNLVCTWSGSVQTGQLYWISFTGSDTSTGNRTAQTRTDNDGTGPGLTDANWTSGDYEIHLVQTYSSSITFDAGETTVEDDNLFGGSFSSGLSYKTSSGTVGATDASTYAEIATAIIPASGGGGATLRNLLMLGVGQ